MFWQATISAWPGGGFATTSYTQAMPPILRTSETKWQRPPRKTDGATLRYESLGKEDNEHEVSLRPFVGTLWVTNPIR